MKHNTQQIVDLLCELKNTPKESKDKISKLYKEFLNLRGEFNENTEVMKQRLETNKTTN